MMPETWGRISTRSMARTRPEKSSHSVTDLSRAFATETGTGGGVALAAAGAGVDAGRGITPFFQRAAAPMRTATAVRVRISFVVVFIRVPFSFYTELTRFRGRIFC